MSIVVSSKENVGVSSTQKLLRPGAESGLTNPTSNNLTSKADFSKLLPPQISGKENRSANNAKDSGKGSAGESLVKKQSKNSSNDKVNANEKNKVVADKDIKSVDKQSENHHVNNDQDSVASSGANNSNRAIIQNVVTDDTIEFEINSEMTDGDNLGEVTSANNYPVEEQASHIVSVQNQEVPDATADDIEDDAEYFLSDEENAQESDISDNTDLVDIGVVLNDTDDFEGHVLRQSNIRGLGAEGLDAEALEKLDQGLNLTSNGLENNGSENGQNLVQSDEAYVNDNAEITPELGQLLAGNQQNLESDNDLRINTQISPLSESDATTTSDQIQGLSEDAQPNKGVRVSDLEDKYDTKIEVNSETIFDDKVLNKDSSQQLISSSANLLLAEESSESPSIFENIARDRNSSAEQLEDIDGQLDLELSMKEFTDSSENFGGDSGKNSNHKTASTIIASGGEIIESNNKLTISFSERMQQQMPEKIAEPSEQLNMSLKHAISSGKSELKINLYPRALGAIEVTIEVSENSVTGQNMVSKIKISAENRQSLEILEKSQAELSKALSEVAESKDASLEFDMKERQDSKENAMHYSNEEERQKWMDKFADSEESSSDDMSSDGVTDDAGANQDNQGKHSDHNGNLNIEV